MQLKVDTKDDVKKTQGAIMLHIKKVTKLKSIIEIKGTTV